MALVVVVSMELRLEEVSVCVLDVCEDVFDKGAWG